MARVFSISEDGELSTSATNDTKTSTDGTMSYKLSQVQTWKGPASSTLTTPTSLDACGVPNLVKGWDYFLTGKKGKNGEITITSCDFIVRQHELTPQEHDLLIELHWHPEKCQEKDGEKSGKGDENSVKETDEKPTQETDEKPVQGTDEKPVEENNEKPAGENDDKAVEEDGGEPVQGDDEKTVQETDEKPMEGDDEKMEEESA
ncbi:hypothetical protein ANCCEY_06202 [Ancylostoma ceylanicum]|nr:hypothetical protein ANCCEY_06202 [Ancylostoma ceylanicum]